MANSALKGDNANERSRARDAFVTYGFLTVMARTAGPTPAIGSWDEERSFQSAFRRCQIQSLQLSRHLQARNVPFLPSTLGFLSMCITFTSNPEPLIVCCASVCTRYRLSAVLVARNGVIGKDFAIFFLAVD